MILSAGDVTRLLLLTVWPANRQKSSRREDKGDRSPQSLESLKKFLAVYVTSKAIFRTIALTGWSVFTNVTLLTLKKAFDAQESNSF